MKAKIIPIAGALALTIFMVPMASAQDFDREGDQDGKRHRMPIEEISTALGFSSSDEFKEAFDPETTNLHEFAVSLGVDLSEIFPKRSKGHLKLLEETGLTMEEFHARMEAGETPQDIAAEYGIELPERDGERKGKKKGQGKFLEATGLTAEEVEIRLDSGETIEDIAAEFGIELPNKNKHKSGGLGVRPGGLE